MPPGEVLTDNLHRGDYGKNPQNQGVNQKCLSMAKYYKYLFYVNESQ